MNEKHGMKHWNEKNLNKGKDNQKGFEAQHCYIRDV